VGGGGQLMLNLQVCVRSAAWHRTEVKDKESRA